MPLATRHTPGIYIEEVSRGPKPITAVGTSTPGFVGDAPKADAFPLVPQAVNNWSQFLAKFVPEEENVTGTDLSTAVFGFFENGGTRCYVVNTAGEPTIQKGLEALRTLDEIAIVAAPGKTDPLSHSLVKSHCELAKDRVGIVDVIRDVDDLSRFEEVETVPSPDDDGPIGQAKSSRGGGGGKASETASGEGGLKLQPSAYIATYWPWITVFEPLSQTLVDAPPSGHVAGMWARVDATRGVHKAPANEPINALNVTYRLTRDEQGVLNDNGINGIRLFAREGIRVWGARTSDDPASEWRYVSVRRLFNMIEESIEEGTNWVVFEPNDRTLWKHIRRDIGAFLTRVWRDGALMGATPEDAFFVKCDEETNPPEVIDAGELHAVIGLAPVKPAEFIVFEISQSTAGAEVTG
jgi:phage tail sheath protein FI